MVKHRGSPPSSIDTEITYGLRAVLAIFAVRRGEILRIGYSRNVEADLEPLLLWARAARVSASALNERELENITGSPHHEGVCVEARARTWMKPAALALLVTRSELPLIAFDRVRNPYNIGAILRTAAFFGLPAALFGSSLQEALAYDAVRVAEGGVEHLRLSRTTDLADSLSRLRKAGGRVYGADGHANASATSIRPRAGSILVMGHEREGLSPRVRTQCDEIVAIHGTSAVESLNVAVAAGILMSRFVAS